MVTTKLAAALPAALVVAAALVAACAGASNEAARPAKPPFPMTLKAPNGSVTLKHRPTRIVSLSPTATEDLFAIGAGKQVIAVDDQSNYPAQAPRTKLSGYTPNAEAVAAYRPDLVVVSGDANGLLRALKKLHISVLLERPAPTLTRAYAQIDQLGRATGHVKAATRLVMRLRGRIAALVKATRRTRAGVVLVDSAGNEISTAGKPWDSSRSAITGVSSWLGSSTRTSDSARRFSAPASRRWSGDALTCASPAKLLANWDITSLQIGTSTPVSKTAAASKRPSNTTARLLHDC